jgi:hypothetical protein
MAVKPKSYSETERYGSGRQGAAQPTGYRLKIIGRISQCQQG